MVNNLASTPLFITTAKKNFIFYHSVIAIIGKYPEARHLTEGYPAIFEEGVYANMGSRRKFKKRRSAFCVHLNFDD